MSIGSSFPAAIYRLRGVKSANLTQTLKHTDGSTEIRTGKKNLENGISYKRILKSHPNSLNLSELSYDFRNTNGFIECKNKTVYTSEGRPQFEYIGYKLDLYRDIITANQVTKYGYSDHSTDVYTKYKSVADTVFFMILTHTHSGSNQIETYNNGHSNSTELVAEKYSRQKIDSGQVLEIKLGYNKNFESHILRSSEHIVRSGNDTKLEYNYSIDFKDMSQTITTYKDPQGQTHKFFGNEEVSTHTINNEASLLIAASFLILLALIRQSLCSKKITMKPSKTYSV